LHRATRDPSAIAAHPMRKSPRRELPVHPDGAVPITAGTPIKARSRPMGRETANRRKVMTKLLGSFGPSTAVEPEARPNRLWRPCEEGDAWIAQSRGDSVRRTRVCSGAPPSTGARLPRRPIRWPIPSGSKPSHRRRRRSAQTGRTAREFEPASFPQDGILGEPGLERRCELGSAFANANGKNPDGMVYSA
jgi:hypothetical protein